MQGTKSSPTQRMVIRIATTAIVMLLATSAFAVDIMPDTLIKPTVSFTGAPASAPDGSSFTVVATTNDGTTATIAASGSCTISGDTVTMTKSSGTCTTKASWPATKTYASAKATQKTTATIAYVESIIDVFGSQNFPDGFAPTANGLVFDKNGNLYATVQNSVGSLNSDGAVVELTPQGKGVWKETVLYIFNRRSTGFNGYNPVGTLAIDSKGNLYGTTARGGSGTCTSSGVPPSVVGCGAVYELSPPTGGGTAWTATGLYSFQGSGTEGSGGTDGFWPTAGVTPQSTAATVLYGTTTCGGTGKLTDSGDTCGDSSGSGTNANGAGTVYELTYTKPTKTNPGGWKENILYNFSGNGSGNGGADGWNPESGLLLKSGNLYGTTCNGGIESGAVYELSPGTPWTEKVLHSFDGTDGACPMYGPPAVDTNGNLYGTTNQGGTSSNGNGFGTAWELVYSTATNTYTEQTLYTFGTQATDGTNPSWGLVSYKGNWYGTTGGFNSLGFGGTNPYGTAFELSDSASAGWTETIIHQFDVSLHSSDLGNPGWNQLIVDKNGNLYGMAPEGPDGQTQAGGIFEISPE